jgi:hypothetical protein
LQAPGEEKRQSNQRACIWRIDTELTLPMTTSEATEQRFPNASNGRETFQSADLLGHKPKQGIVSGNCFAEFVSYNGEGESLKSGRNRRLIEASAVG